MDAGELFLSCNNLTLGQYRIIVLTRGLAGAAGFVISLAVLGIVLLTAKKKAWEMSQDPIEFIGIWRQYHRLPYFKV